MKKEKNGFLFIIILAIVGGLVAGMFGEIFTRVYVLKDLYVPYFNQELDLADLNSGRSNLIIREAKKVVVNQDVKVSETVSSIQPSLMGVHRKTNVSSRLEYYDLENPDFLALAITSDGWLVASIPDNTKNAFNVKNYIAISSSREVYEIDEISSFSELPGNLIFFHLKEVSNLAVKKNIKRTELSLGKSLLVVNDFNNALLSSISALEAKEGALSSESLNTRLTLSNEITDNLKNSFVFDLGGNLVAVVASNKEIIPVFAYEHYWQSFFKERKVSRPYLGVNYLDLNKVVSLELKMDKGAWLYSTKAVIKGSPAEKGGLQVGDVITWIDNKEVNGKNDLADIISEYEPNEAVTITYVRDNEEKRIELRLGEKNN